VPTSPTTRASLPQEVQNSDSLTITISVEHLILFSHFHSIHHIKTEL